MPFHLDMHFRPGMWMGRALCVLVLMVLVTRRAEADSISLVWDQNLESDIAGYTVFYGTASGTYTNAVDVGNVTSWTVTGLTDGQHYYFAVDAYTSDGTHSTLSSEVGIPATVSAVSVSPAFGSGAAQIFTLQYGDTAGATDLGWAWVWVNATFASSSANSCLAYYDRATNTINLLNDAGTAYTAGTVGGGGTLQNSQCSIAMGSETTATISDTTLTLNLAMTFTPAFGGTKNVYMYAANAAAVNSAWQRRGDWTVPGPGTPVVTANAVSPTSGSGATQTFTLQYGDTAGATDLARTWVWVNATFASSSANSCLAYYDRASNRINLLDDAATAYAAETVGSSGTLQNSQCSIEMGTSTSVTLSGTTLTLNLAMTFAPAFSGEKNVYVYAANPGGVNSGWQARGVWTAP